MEFWILGESFVFKGKLRNRNAAQGVNWFHLGGLVVVGVWFLVLPLRNCSGLVVFFYHKRRFGLGGGWWSLGEFSFLMVGWGGVEGV